MIERTTTHETIVLERDYDAPVERVFRAFADPRARARWDVPSDGWEIAELIHEFRVGGRDAMRFGPKGDPRYYGAGFYLAIEPNVRIVKAGTMHDRDKPMTCTLSTVEFQQKSRGTHLVLTDQSAYFGTETNKQRRGGWGSILDKLALHFQEEDQTP